MRVGWIVVGLALAACNPQEVADKVVARTAEGVVSAAVGPQAARCVVDNASPAELRALAVDVGVEAGTTTMVNIMTIARRPETLSCLVASGVGPLRG
ncbi:MAG: hypothetical protein ABI832_05410 [bacterium]